MSDVLGLPFGTGLESASAQRYLVLQLLGRGGNAETYLALQASGSSCGIFFAIKVFRRLSKPQWRANFLEEIDLLSTCNHPAIMRVFDRGSQLDEHPFLVIEYLPETFDHVIQRSTIAVVEKLFFALQLVAALDYLARNDLVHRDVKPSNIFLKGGACVLGDFGLAKRWRAPTASADEDREHVRHSGGPGMPRFYRTPDLVAYLRGGANPSCQSDVFQLGLVLAELFTGSNPLEPLPGDDFTAPVILNSLPAIPGIVGKPIQNLIQSMLAIDPGQRPTAAELLSLWQGLYLRAAQHRLELEGKVLGS